MILERLHEIKKRAEEATEGPWETVNGNGVFTTLGATNKAGQKAEDNDGWQIAVCDEYLTSVNGELVEMSFAEESSNAKFIANARQDIPDLIAEVERLRKVLTHFSDLAEVFYTFPIPLLNGEISYAIPGDMNDSARGFISEVFIVSEEALNNDGSTEV